MWKSLTRNFSYDLTIVGGGPGGYVAAIKAGQLGFKVACVEKRGTLGGTCLNVGCIPSKALLNASHKYHEAKHEFSKYGIKTTGLSYDWMQMQGAKDKAVGGLTKGIETLFKKNKVDYIKGYATFKDKNTLLVDNQEVRSKNIVIATGSEVSTLPSLPLDEKRIISSTGALALQQVPSKMLVVGAGFIGLELGSVYARLGAQVTVVEFLDRIVPSMDFEVSKALQKELVKQGLKINLQTSVTKVDVGTSGVKVHFNKGDPVDVDVVLVATGRRPYTDKLGLDKVGVKVNPKGFIPSDQHFKTNVDNIFAIGDVREQGPMLAHKAEEEGVALVEQLKGLAGHVNYNAIPGVIYTHPEAASVGLTEEQVKAQNIPYNKGVFPFMANSRARTNDDAAGFVKVLSHKETDKILGFHIIGSDAGEMIHEAVLAIEYGAASEDIARTCHAHPTLSEAIKEACLATFSKPIHF